MLPLQTSLCSGSPQFPCVFSLSISPHFLRHRANCSSYILSFTGDRTKISVDKSFAIAWYLEHPASIGYLHITSGDDVEVPLDFHPGFLDRPEDMALHKWGYKLSREFARRMPSYRGEVLGGHPDFPPNSKLVAKAHDGPVPISEPDFDHTEEDEKAVEDYVRQTVATTWHSVCFPFVRLMTPLIACQHLDWSVCDEEPRAGWSC